MRLRACLDDLPPDYEVVEAERGVLAVDRRHRAVVERAGFGPDGPGRAPASDLAGRVPLGEIRGPHGRFVVRAFHHGGLLRWMNAERFAAPERPFEELLLSHRVASAGIATPRVVAAWARRAPGFGFRLALITERVEGAREASHVLDDVREGVVEEASAARLFAAVGAFLGRAHRAGLVHTDLTPRNLLLSHELLHGEAPTRAAVWVLDLDRCGFDPEMGDEVRRASLARLLRYVVRRDAPERPVLSRGRVGAFLRAYVAALGGAHGWRDEWRALAAGGTVASPLHRIGWAIEEAFGGGPETRDGKR